MTEINDEIAARVVPRGTQEELRVSEIRYRRLFETARDGILILDATTCKITDVNPFMVELLGYPREEFIGKELFEIGLLKDAAASAEAFRELQENGYIRYEDLPLQTKWGKRREVEFISNVYAENDHQVIQCNIRDITERKQAERALRQSAERCRFVAESMPQKIFTAGADGEVDYFNRQWAEFTGLSPAQMVKYGWTHFIHPDDVIENQRLWQHSLATGQAFRCEHRFQRADGVYRWHLSHAHAMHDEHNNILMWIGSNTDVDDQKQIQAEMSRLMVLEQVARATAEMANHTKDEFLATVSHELRTPLTVILGWAGILRQGTLDEVESARALEIIEHNVKVQAQVIEDILDVSRITTGKLRLAVKPVHLASVINNALASFSLAAEARSIKLTTHLDPDVGVVTGDVNRLQQVMSNLLTNAIKFTPPQGRVEVRLERVNSDAHITVSDNGKGIAGEFMPFVFDSFRQADSSSTRAYSGLGLGLSIVRNIVEMHGGIVYAQSPGEGLGTSFTVSIPLMVYSLDKALPDKALPDNAKPQLAPAKDLNNRTQVSGLRILIVDDEADTREMLSAILQQCGILVQSCSGAKAALEILRQWQPDVLLSDIAMPGEDGYWLIGQVRTWEQKHGKRLAAVALTAYVKVEDRVQVLEAGFDMFVPKPVNPIELLTIIGSLIPERTSFEQLATDTSPA